MSRNIHEETAAIECPDATTPTTPPLSATAGPQMPAADYVLAQARLILGIVSETDAQQLLAAKHQLQHLFETLAKEDEDC